MAVGKVAAHLCPILIVKELKISVENGRVVTTLNIIFCVIIMCNFLFANKYSICAKEKELPHRKLSCMTIHLKPQQDTLPICLIYKMRFRSNKEKKLVHSQLLYNLTRCSLQ